MLSMPCGGMRAQYDVVVIGSGYGGGVAASRLARAGLDVCLLERGREITVGDFPARLSEARRELRITGGKMRIGPANGLFDLHLTGDVNVLTGCGLGGTSLINANVCLRPDPRVFDDPAWPDEIRCDGLLDEGYARAERMLRPRPYTGEPLLKLKALEKASASLGVGLGRAPLHIAFTAGANAAGVIQQACKFCGDCCSGCNVGAKTTTQLTYLPDAASHGAEIFTECTAQSLRKSNDGRWEVVLAEQNGGRGSVSAGIVVLAAGTLGSVEILLRSRSEGLPLPERLGERFSANGDALAVGYNNDMQVNGVGVGYPPKADVGRPGPAVAGLIDLRNTLDVNDSLAFVEASIPSCMAPMLPALLAPGALLMGRDSDGGLSDELDEAGRALSSLIKGAYSGAVHNTQTFLGVGHDACAGRMRLEDDRLVIDWPGAPQQAVYGAIEDRMRCAVAATGGTYLPNPVSTRLMGGKLMTVHPLGGCAIARDRTAGVVNHKGEVFDAGDTANPRAVHHGLYVCDGSVMPRSLGIHPLLTITAFAERAMIHLATSRGLHFDDTRTPGEARELYPPSKPEARPGGVWDGLMRRLGRGPGAH